MWTSVELTGGWIDGLGGFYKEEVMGCEVCGATTGWVDGWKLDSANESKRKAMEEARLLRETVVELLEILRNWEPGPASAEDRRTIMQAMYRVRILTDPTETLRNMTEADFVRAHG